jgi:hypothetical protein
VRKFVTDTTLTCEHTMETAYFDCTGAKYGVGKLLEPVSYECGSDEYDLQHADAKSFFPLCTACVAVGAKPVARRVGVKRRAPSAVSSLGRPSAGDADSSSSSDADATSSSDDESTSSSDESAIDDERASTTMAASQMDDVIGVDESRRSVAAQIRAIERGDPLQPSRTAWKRRASRSPSASD